MNPVSDLLAFNDAGVILCRSFRQAVQMISHVPVALDDRGCKNKKAVVIIGSSGRAEFKHWLWNSFRKSRLNPLVVIGLREERAFLSDNPVFSLYAEEHAYVQLPFLIDHLVDVVRHMKPLYDQATRRLLVQDFTVEYEYKLITHDLKIMQYGRQETIGNLNRVKEYYRSRGDLKLAAAITTAMNDIVDATHWLPRALDIKEYLLREYNNRKGG